MTRQAAPATLEDTLGWALAMVARGVADRRHPFHTPVLATTGLDGTPQARTVVLRGIDPATRQLRLHTDARAGKVAELAAEPRATLMFYDAGAQLQLRLGGRATLHRDDALADEAWAASRDFSRMCYAIEPAPGQAVPAPPAAPLDSQAGRPHFCAVILHLHTLESLHLAAGGHRRARFAWDQASIPSGTPSAAWLVP
ncbi:pyridoxamine 5'-phosphate oxidase family protein [Falsiroseomonas sp.]|uniref:pyridoxamine 5'-phosphate oxidase family protein n=1 Tax=Falsiroseomonas sp. TaxID=2870721 RepID=UPI003F6FBC38